MKPLDLLCILLTIMFVGLKLIGAIDWSWPLVLLPILAPLALAALILGGLGICLLLETPEQRKMRRLRSALKNYADALGKRS